jgi:hypothetical protein
MAERHPRDMDAARQRMLAECRRPGFAKVARYNKPIGAGVEGPSIRFAEMAIRAMKNILPDSTTLFDDSEKRILKISVTDLEANVSYSQDVTITKTVERKKKEGYVVVGERKNSKGETTYIVQATDDDILNKQNALVSKAIRTLGLRLVPGDIMDECMSEVKKTIHTQDAKDPDAARKEIFDGFAQLGVTADALKEYAGHDCKIMTPAELGSLREIWVTLRDGETTWREIMDAKFSAEKQPIKQPGEKREAAPEASGAPDQPALSPAIDISQALAVAHGGIIDIQGYVVDVKHYPESDKGKEKTYYTLADNDDKKLNVSAFGSPFTGAVADGECRLRCNGVSVVESKGKIYYNGDKKNMQVVNA